MQFESFVYWRPKALKGPVPPSLEELQDLLVALKRVASWSTYELLRLAAETQPAERLANALRSVISQLMTYPELLENKGNQEVFKRALTIEEYTSLIEVSGLRGLTQNHRRTVEGLLCLQERGAMVHFLSKVFASLKNHPYIHPLDGEENTCPTPPTPKP
jgi:hypothetical protein